MKVTVTVKLEVDQAAWSDIYGVVNTDSEVRNDVKAYVASTVRDQFEMAGAPVSVTAWF